MTIRFDWRVALHCSYRERLRSEIVESLQHWVEAGRIPEKVIVSPARFDPYDERIVIEIQSILGDVISSTQHIEPSVSETS